MPEANLLPFTVIGRIEHSGQIVCDHVQARSAMHAFAVATKERQKVSDAELMLIVSLPGHQNEGVELTFAGEGEVSGETVLEQTDVFC